VLGGCDPRLGFDPLPAPAALCPPPPIGDLSALFGPSLAERADDTVGANPLCLTPPQASPVLSSSCVSPFELEKRQTWPPITQKDDHLIKDEAARLSLSPTSTTAPFEDDHDENLPSMPDAEYTAFVETLLA